MYDKVGYICGDGTTLCADDAKVWLEHEFDLIECEIEFLMNGPDGSGDFMNEWPVRPKIKNYTDDYIYDASGDVITEYNVYVADNDPIRKIKDKISAIYDDGTWDDGLWCDDCSKELIEAYKAECYKCHSVVAEGSIATTLENLYNYDLILCRKCYLEAEGEAMALIRAELEAYMNPQDNTPYWKYRQYIDFLLKNRKGDTATGFIRHYLPDILTSMQSIMTLADEQHCTPLYRIVDATERAINGDTDLSVAPAFEWVKQKNDELTEREVQHFPAKETA